MSILRAWFARFEGLFGRERRDRELEEELEGHLQLHVEDNLRAGMNPGEARRIAIIKLGGMEQTKEKYRNRRGLPWIETLLQNTRFGLRILRKNPAFTAIVIVTLALGIGANTAIFTVAYATLLAPLPYPQPSRLVDVWSYVQGHRNRVSAADFLDWKQQSTSFEDLNAWFEGDFNIATRDRPEDIVGVYATQGYYGMLGSPLLLGRNFVPDEGNPGKDRVVVLTHRLWLHLGANPNIIGQTIQINGESYTVVGVMAPGMADRREWQLIAPLVFKPEQIRDHHSRYWLVTGRLRTGISINQAQAELDAITGKEAKEYPTSNDGWGALVEPFKNDLLASDRRESLWLLLCAVAFLLLIACLNVANLLLAKGIARQGEVAIRASLGAKPSAIFSQFLTESLVLAMLGCVLGIGIGYVLLRALIAVIPPGVLPAEAELRLNLPVLFIMLAAAMVTGLLFGCAPAWYASRMEPAGALKDGGNSGTGVSRHMLRRALVIIEFALTLPLLTGAGMTIHSFWNLTHIDLGVSTDHILGFYLIPGRLPEGPEQIDSYYRSILAKIAAVPGVSHVCALSYLPLDRMHAQMPFGIPGRPEFSNLSLRPSADLETVTPDCFQTFGIRIVRGRGFNDGDNTTRLRVAIVNETFVSRFLNGVDPLQQRLEMEQVIYPDPQNRGAVEWQIVGVFHTVKSRGSREDNPEVDTPFWQGAYPESGIGVRTAQDPEAMVKSIAAAVNAVDAQGALALTRTMEQVHDEGLANDRFITILFTCFAVVALLLAAVGIYGVTAFSAAQRSHEIAVRMALGASSGQVISLVVKEGLVLACTGLGLGLTAACFVGRAIHSILFEVSAIDSWSFASVGLGLLLAAVLACYLPARRATRINLMRMLRNE